MVFTLAYAFRKSEKSTHLTKLQISLRAGTEESLSITSVQFCSNATYCLKRPVLQPGPKLFVLTFPQACESKLWSQHQTGADFQALLPEAEERQV